MEKQIIENFLGGLINGEGVLYDAMRYSLLGGGKRLRPQIACMAAEALGAEEKDALYYGAALECIHTYSLIHDDLPCMDDDDLRRGRPTCHKKYGEAIALLAGDGLLTLAFQIVAEAPLSEKQNIRAVKVLSANAGAYGMVEGQTIDMLLSDGTEEEVLEMYSYKTGALLRTAAALGAIAAGGDGTELEAFSKNLGVAFQIRDDILDIIGDEKKLGKPIKSDAKNEKNTIVTVVGMERAEKMVWEYTERAKAALAPLGDKAAALRALADSLVEREM